MIPEEDISDAIARGDRQAVRAWLNAKDSDVNSRSVDGPTLLGTCVMAAAQSQSRNEARNQLEIGRLLVARGARATKLGKARLLRAPLVMPITSLRRRDPTRSGSDART
jgi:predicted GNAT family N-acyltransferase